MTLKTDRSHRRPRFKILDGGFVFDVRSVHEFAQRAKWFCVQCGYKAARWETIEAAEFKAVQEDHEARDVFPRPPYLISAKGVTAFAGSRYLITRRSILSDEVAFFKDHSGWSPRIRRIFSVIAGRLAIKSDLTEIDHIERGVHLLHEYSDNYFHAFAEVLPRILLAADLTDSKFPFIVEDDLHPNIESLVEIIAKGRVIIRIPRFSFCHFDELIFISDVSSVQDIYSRLALPNELDLHISLIRSVMEAVTRSLSLINISDMRRKLYLHRGLRLRALSNESEIEAYLISEGFEAVNTDTMSLREQIVLFQQAAIVVSPTGAALTNMIWCRAASFMVLAADHPAMDLKLWEQLASVSGCTMHFLKVKTHPDADLHADFVVPLELMMRALRDLGVCRGNQ